MMKVFVSYSRKDGDFVRRLVSDLEQRGIDAWVDTQDIANTDEDSWRAAITDAIDASAAFILVLSPDSVVSEPVGREVMVAADSKRRIVPLVTRGPVALPSGLRFQLAGVHRIDFTELQYAHAFEQLMQRLTTITGPVPAAPVAPVAPLPPPPPPVPLPSGPTPNRRRTLTLAGAGAVVALATAAWLIVRATTGDPEASADIEAQTASCDADGCASAPIRFVLSSGEPGDEVTSRVTWPDGDRGGTSEHRIDGDGTLEWTWEATRSDPVGAYDVTFEFSNGATVDRSFEVVPVEGPYRAVQAVAADLIDDDWEGAQQIDRRLEEADVPAIADSYSSYEVRRWVPRDSQWTDSGGTLVMTGAFVGYDRDVDSTRVDCEIWTTTDGGATMRSDAIPGPSGTPLGHTEGGRMSPSAVFAVVADLCVPVDDGSGGGVQPPPTTVSPGAEVLQIGSHGELVSELQTLLNAAHYSAGNVDGVFGMRTHIALQLFQTDLGAETDGRIAHDGPEWRDLEAMAQTGQCRLQLDDDGVTVVEGEDSMRNASFTVTCRGDAADLTIEGMSVVEGGSVEGYDCSLFLGAGDHCNVGVVVNDPVGAVEVVLEVAHDGIGSPTRVTMVEAQTGGVSTNGCELTEEECVSTTTPVLAG